MASNLGDVNVNTSFHFASANTTTQRSTLSDHSSWQTDAPNSSHLQECIKVSFSEREYLPWNNPDNIVSVEVENYTRKAKNTLLVFLFLIGGPANVINMAVFYKQSLKNRVNLCLFSLALADELYLISAMFMHAEISYLPFSVVGTNVSFRKFMFNNNLILGAGISFVLSAIIACERCYCVFSPLKYQNVVRTRTMAVLIIAVYLIVSGLFFVVKYKYRIGCVYDPRSGTVSDKMIVGPFYKRHKALIDQIDNIVFGAGLPGGMISIVTTATIVTTVKLRQIMSWRTETSSSLSSQEVALTKMLIGSSVLFIICVTPSCVFRIVRFILPEINPGGRHQNFFFTSLCILEAFCFMNSTFNFFVYYVMGSRYRETFWALFSRKDNQKK